MTISFKELVSLPEFREAWQREFMIRVENNYTKKTQDEQARQIIQSILEVQDFYNLDYLENLARIAKEQKHSDERWSLFSDIFKIGTAACLSFIKEIRLDDEPDLIPAKYPYVAVSVFTAATYLKTFYHGYQSAITSDLSRRLADSLLRVIDDLNKNDYASNHQVSSASGVIENKKDSQGGYDNYREILGLTLSFVAFVGEVPRFLFNFPKVTGVNKYFGKAFGSEDRIEFAASFTEIVSGGSSILGKYVSCKALERDKEIIESKIKLAGESWEGFCNLQNPDLLTIKLSLERLSRLYNSQIKEPDFLTKYAKSPFNSALNSLYGLTYEGCTIFYPYKSFVNQENRSSFEMMDYRYEEVSILGDLDVDLDMNKDITYDKEKKEKQRVAREEVIGLDTNSDDAVRSSNYSDNWYKEMRFEYPSVSSSAFQVPINRSTDDLLPSYSYLISSLTASEGLDGEEFFGAIGEESKDNDKAVQTDLENCPKIPSTNIKSSKDQISEITGKQRSRSLPQI